MIQVFDLAIHSVQVGYAFIPYLEVHISFRVDIKAKIYGLGEDFKTALSDLSVPSEELRQVFFSKFIENLQEV